MDREEYEEGRERLRELAFFLQIIYSIYLTDSEEACPGAGG